MNKIIENELNTIKDSILKTVPAEVIYLFGSYAYGIPNKDSDLDIYVLVPAEYASDNKLEFKIRKELYYKKKMPMDLMIADVQKFNERKNKKTTLEYKVASDGVMIYGQ